MTATLGGHIADSEGEEEEDDMLMLEAGGEDDLEDNSDSRGSFNQVLTVGENIIATIKMRNNFWYLLNMVIFQYLLDS